MPPTPRTRRPGGAARSARGCSAGRRAGAGRCGSVRFRPGRAGGRTRRRSAEALGRRRPGPRSTDAVRDPARAARSTRSRCTRGPPPLRGAARGPTPRPQHGHPRPGRRRDPRRRGTADAVALDLADRTSIQAAVDRADQLHGRLDGAFNNGAAIQQPGPLDTTSDQDVDEQFAVNFRAQWTAMNAEAALMRLRGGGAIVNTSRIGSRRANPALPAYGAMKRALNSITETAAVTWARDRIRRARSPRWRPGLHRLLRTIPSVIAFSVDKPSSRCEVDGAHDCGEHCHPHVALTEAECCVADLYESGHREKAAVSSSRTSATRSGRAIDQVRTPDAHGQNVLERGRADSGQRYRVGSCLRSSTRRRRGRPLR